ncbi:hypothetical protein E3J74_04615 [Candidatus Bathyarchaeota archaeon]|nr:MAG: hypothetical protein E3J74_04615 [Candidatus Bathyarchaeota archaeon]
MSNAEIDIFYELRRRKLVRGLTRQHPFVFDLKKDIVAGTTIDLFWGTPEIRPHYAAFIDGVAVGKTGVSKLHLTSRQQRRDEFVTAALERRGIRVDRFPYEPPLRKWRKLEICDAIEAVLKKSGY